MYKLYERIVNMQRIMFFPGVSCNNTMLFFT